MLGALVVPPRSSLPTKGTEAQERPLSLMMGWAGGEAVGSGCSCFSYTSNAVCLGLPGAGLGELEPHLHVQGFSQWCLVLEELVVVLVKGSEVRNYLCYHLGDSTPH